MWQNEIRPPSTQAQQGNSPPPPPPRILLSPEWEMHFLHKMRTISPAWEWETISLCCIEAESLSQKAAQFMLSWAFSIKFLVPFLLDCNFMMVSRGMCQGSFVGELLNSINSKTIRNFHLYFQPIKRNGPRKWKFEMVWSGYIIEKGRDRVK